MLTLFSLLGILAICAGALVAGWFIGRRRAPALEGARSGVKRLPVVTTCAECAHFSLEGGQEEMRRNPAFFAASQILAPWRMGRQRQFDWHPEYAPLHRELELAIASKNVDTVADVQRRIDALVDRIGDVGHERSPSEYVPEDHLSLKWTDFGACKKHKQLCAKSDTCEDFTARAVNA